MFEMLLATKPAGAAPGIGNAYVAGGQSGSTVLNTISKYNWASTTMSAASNLTTVRAAASGASNLVKGISASGFTTATAVSTEEYVFASDARAVITSVAAARRWLAGASNSQLAVFRGGWNSSYRNSTDRFSFADNSRINGVNMAVARSTMGAAGNGVNGYWVGGENSSFPATNRMVTRYNYTSDLDTESTTLESTRNNTAGAGTNDFGIFVGAFAGVATTVKLSYADDTSVPSGTLPGARSYTMACSDPTMLLTSGGTDNTRATYVMNFATEISTTWTQLSVSRDQPCGFSSTPGHLA